MRPVKTATSNLVYHGPTGEIGDLWCRRIRPGHIRSIWEPSAQERRIIAEGGRIELDLLNEPIPPIALNVVPAEASEPVGEHPFRVPDEEVEALRGPSGGTALHQNDGIHGADAKPPGPPDPPMHPDDRPVG